MQRKCVMTTTQPFHGDVESSVSATQNETSDSYCTGNQRPIFTLDMQLAHPSLGGGPFAQLSWDESYNLVIGDYINGMNDISIR